MLLGSIDILMSKNIRYKINIAGFLIKRCAICTSQLVRRDLFGSCDLSGIFFHQILDSLDTDPATLGRIEECMLMAGQRCNIFPHFQIFFQSFFYLSLKTGGFRIEPPVSSCYNGCIRRAALETSRPANEWRLLYAERYFPDHQPRAA